MSTQAQPSTAPQTAIDAMELARRFNAHQPESWQVHAMEEMRQMLHDCARRVAEIVPKGREQSLAITHLEEAMFQANAGISRYKAPKEASGAS